MAFPKDKLDLQKIASDNIGDTNKKLIELYNLIITTKTQTYDTSEYNRFKYVSSYHIDSVIDTGKKALFLMKKKNNLNNAFETGDDVVIIFETGLEDVKIKSKRYFLNNQEAIIKK